LPAAGPAGPPLLVLAVVASGFAAGWLTRTTPSAPAAAPASTVPGFIDEGPETGRRDFNWEAQGGGLTVELRSLIVGTGFTRLELRVDGGGPRPPPAAPRRRRRRPAGRRGDRPDRHRRQPARPWRRHRHRGGARPAHRPAG